MRSTKPLWRERIYQKRASIFLVAYIALLFLLLKNIFSVIYSGSSYFSGFLYSFDMTSTLIGIPFLALVSTYVIKRINAKEFSDNVIFLLNMIYFIPGTVYIISMNAGRQYLLLLIGYWIVLVLAQWLIPYPQRQMFGKIKMDHSQAIRLLTGGMIILSVAIAVQYGNGIEAFMDVYAVRLEARESDIHWLIKLLYKIPACIIPVLVAYYIKDKHYFTVLLLAVAQILLFTIAANKSYLFMLAVVPAFAIIRADVKNLPFLCSLLCAAAFLECLYTHMNGEGIIQYVIRRFFMTPAYAGRFYYNYFIGQGNRLFYFEESLGRLWSLLGLPNYHAYSAGREVGMQLSTSLNLNTGLVGAAIASYGVAGVFVCPVLHVFAFRFLDLATKRMENALLWLSFAIVIIVEVLNSNYFPEQFIQLSGLLFATIAVSMLANRENATQNVAVARSDENA